MQAWIRKQQKEITDSDENPTQEAVPRPDEALEMVKMRKINQLQFKMILAYQKLEMSFTMKPKMKAYGKRQKF